MAKSEGYNVTCSTDSVGDLISIIEDFRVPKSLKQAALTRLRELELRDGKSYYDNYNGVSRNPSEMARWEEERESPRVKIRDYEDTISGKVIKS